MKGTGWPSRTRPNYPRRRTVRTDNPEALTINRTWPASPTNQRRCTAVKDWTERREPTTTPMLSNEARALERHSLPRNTEMEGSIQWNPGRHTGAGRVLTRTWRIPASRDTD